MTRGNDPGEVLCDLVGPALLHRTERWYCLVDGGSGSGKTTLAQQLARWFAEQGRRSVVVSLDDFYPGWDGLAAGSEMVWQDVLGRGGFRRWDWQAERPGEWVTLPGDADLIIEGCGAVTAQSERRADLTLWLEMPTAVRRKRALGRDAELFAPHWDRWAAQEVRHWAEDSPRELADLVLEITDGSCQTSGMGEGMGDQNREIEDFLESYRALMGFVPPRVQARFDNLRQSNPELLLAQEQLRALVTNPADLDELTVQLLLFAILASRLSDAAKLHGWAARRAGASYAQLQQVLDLSQLFAGQSVANRAPSVIAEIRALEEEHGLGE